MGEQIVVGSEDQAGIQAIIDEAKTTGRSVTRQQAEMMWRAQKFEEDREDRASLYRRSTLPVQKPVLPRPTGNSGGKGRR